MKKLYILMIALFVFNVSNAQTYTISFAATGAATTVDSVKVENLTHTAIATWHASDVFQLQLSNGINEMDVNNDNLQVYPNPMQGQAEISFYAKQAGKATLSIYDIAGKEVLQTESKLLQGIQKYQLAGLKQGMYFINISSDSYFYTAKLISQNAAASKTIIKYIGNEKPEVAAFSTLKNTKATVTMAYYTGDNLRFTGYAGTHSAIVNDVPTASKTITFAFMTTICPQTATDIDGNIYSIVSIGNQCWMGENLKTTHYRNGDSIPNVSDNNTWIALTTGAFCNKDNTPSNSITYGRLYNFYSIIDARNLCPTNWHVPRDSEWSALESYLGGDSLTGGKLKEAGIIHWLSPNVGATNEYGFTALPGGGRGCNGVFNNIGSLYVGTWWSSTVYDTSRSWDISFYNDESKAYKYNDSKSNGYSVRCLRD